MTAAISRNYEPAHLVPPGATLSEWLARSDMTQADFAKRASLTPKHINQVVKGSVGISPDVAIAFERVTAIPARYWMQLDANFQTARQRASESAKLLQHVGLVDRFPISDLVRTGCLERKSPKIEQLKELLRFFAVADPDALESVWLKPALYRKSATFKADEGALAGWLRLAELQASEIATQPFDLTAAREALPTMRKLSALPGIEWIEPLIELCAAVGVALVILKELPKCRINGATRWLAPDKALVALSLRHRRNDIFWFTLFHEFCHVLRHSKKELFVDGKGSGISAELEAEADAFASRTLIPVQYLPQLRGLSTVADVRKFSSAVGIAPGIVVGRLQHDGLIHHSQWTDLIDRYRFTDD